MKKHVMFVLTILISTNTVFSQDFNSIFPRGSLVDLPDGLNLVSSGALLEFQSSGLLYRAELYYNYLPSELPPEKPYQVWNKLTLKRLNNGSIDTRWLLRQEYEHSTPYLLLPISTPWYLGIDGYENILNFFRCDNDFAVLSTKEKSFSHTVFNYETNNFADHIVKIGGQLEEDENSFYRKLNSFDDRQTVPFKFSLTGGYEGEGWFILDTSHNLLKVFLVVNNSGLKNTYIVDYSKIRNNYKGFTWYLIINGEYVKIENLVF